MSNPTYEQDSIKKMKAPGIAITGKDSSALAEVIGVHKTTPPTLADGDFAQAQMDDMGNLKVSLGDPSQITQVMQSKGAISNQAPVSIGNVSATAITLTAGKTCMTIQNIGNAMVFIGGSGVTSSSYAFKIVPMQIFDFGQVKSTFSFYAICAAATTSSIGVCEYA